jgi:tRNA modification GTPase
LLTPPGRGALAVVGVAGADATALLGRLFRPHRTPPTVATAVVGRWVEVMPGTVGEEVVVTTDRQAGMAVHEIHCHGGEAAPGHLLAGLAAAGATVVDWREWLARLGATADEIAAREALGRGGGPKAGAILGRQLAGALDGALAELRGCAATDPTEARRRAHRLRAAAAIGLRFERPWRVVLAGPVNAGKSSLANALAGHERSLVSPEAGTTRDLLVARLVLHGWEVELVDTAGLRPAGGPTGATEAAGIAAARGALAGADLVLRVHVARDPSPPRVGAGEILVLSQADAGVGEVPPGAVLTSAVTGAGIEELAAMIVDRLVPEERGDPALLAGPVPFTQRQIVEIEAIVPASPR